MKRLLLVLSVCLACLSYGCGPKIHNKVVGGTINTYLADPDSAVVIFMRPSYRAERAPAAIYDYYDETLTEVGVITGYQKIAYTTSPGKHYFRSNCYRYDPSYMEAELVAGKVYYIYLWSDYYNYGTYLRDYRFPFKPIAAGEAESAKVQNWIDSCVYVEKIDLKKALSSAERAEIVNGFENWEKTPDEERVFMDSSSGVPFSRF